MPNQNEHAASVKDETKCTKFKRVNQGHGVSLVLCDIDDKMQAVSYRFNKDEFTEEQAKAWLDKHNITFKKFTKAKEGDEKMSAKLSMKALNGKPEVDGRIWSSGMHHVFVNDKPAKVYVPEKTIMDTFQSIRGLIQDQGRMPIGIDHLSNNVLEENEILAKMNLLDVGDVTQVGTDGRAIYILDSEIKNDAIRALNKDGELPAYSIVGAMEAEACPSGKADYVVKNIDVERVDFVEEGGCQVCQVGAQPDELILTSKQSKENLNMIEENEAQIEDVVEEQSEAVTDENKVEEEAEESVENEEEEVVEVEEEEEEESSEIAALKEEISSLKNEIKELGGKKPKPETGSVEAKNAVKDLVSAGKATPRMKKALISLYDSDKDAFDEMKASLPKMVSMKTEAKFAKVDKQKQEAENKASEDAEIKKQLEEVFRVKL